MIHQPEGHIAVQTACRCLVADVFASINYAELCENSVNFTEVYFDTFRMCYGKTAGPAAVPRSRQTLLQTGWYVSGPDVATDRLVRGPDVATDRLVRGPDVATDRLVRQWSRRDTP